MSMSAVHEVEQRVAVGEVYTRSGATTLPERNHLERQCRPLTLLGQRNSKRSLDEGGYGRAVDDRSFAHLPIQLVRKPDGRTHMSKHVLFDAEMLLRRTWASYLDK